MEVSGWLWSEIGRYSVNKRKDKECGDEGDICVGLG